MSKLAETFWPEERLALRPPERIPVSEWADRYRFLDPIHCSQDGPWRTDFTPYMREIMDCWCDEHTRVIVVMCSTQVGKTEGGINCLFYTIDQDPAPTLVVQPNREDVESFGQRRLRTAIDWTPRVRAHKTGRKADWKRTEIGLDNMIMYLGWAGSAARLASRSIGRLLADELDKWPDYAGRESDPVHLALERLRWYEDSKAWLASTPLHKDGYIFRHWLQSDQRRYHVPCPFCGAFQPLEFTRQRVVWPKEIRDPERIKNERLARYVCVSCEREIEDDDIMRERMSAAGVWCPQGAKVTRAGNLKGAGADPEVRGYHVNALYSPMLSWSAVAARFLASRHSPGLLAQFTRDWLGWPWEERTTEVLEETIAKRAVATPPGVVPKGCVVLTAGVDVQEDVLYYAIRAHAVGERSVTIAYGRVKTFEDLDEVLFRSAFPLEDSNKVLPVALACIDSQYRQDEVYRFCAVRPHVARPLKCWDRRAVPFSASKIERDWLGKARGVLQLWNLDVNYFKTKLNTMIHTELGTDRSWGVHGQVEEEFCQQMSAEHMIKIRRRGTVNVTTGWVKKPTAGGNHWWDCEVYNTAAADMLGVYAMKPTEPTSPAPPDEPSRPRKPRRSGPRRVEKGWIRKRGER